MLHAEIISKHTKLEKKTTTTKNQREGKVCSLPMVSPAAGLSCAPGVAAEEGSAVPAHSARLPPC